MKKPKVVILNITHGDNPYMDKSPFLPVAAGACRSDITNDASGEDNISNKNKWYGDFTSLYWAWKNLKDVDIIGTSHYRRYLSDIDYLEHASYDLSWSEFYYNKYKVNQFEKDLKQYDFVMARTVEYECSLRSQYLECHPYPHNLEVVRKTLKEMHPEALPIWDKYMDGNILRYGFIFITTWTNFDKLCGWLYPILQRCEEQIKIEEFHGHQERVIAYLYERLVPIFLETYNMKIKSYPMFFIDEASRQTIKGIKRTYWKQHSYIYRSIKSIYYTIKNACKK